MGKIGLTRCSGREKATWKGRRDGWQRDEIPESHGCVGPPEAAESLAFMEWDYEWVERREKVLLKICCEERPLGSVLLL